MTEPWAEEFAVGGEPIPGLVERMRLERAIRRDNELTDAEWAAADAVPRPPVPISELVGCLGPDWTGGLDSVEFVRRQRR